MRKLTYGQLHALRDAAENELEEYKEDGEENQALTAALAKLVEAIQWADASRGRRAAERKQQNSVDLQPVR